MQTPKNKFNFSMHGLRGFSALMILFFHLYDMPRKHGLWIMGDTENLPSYLMKSFRFGVEIFFIISGYLITKSIIKHQSVRNFLLDRFIRIYPVFIPLHFTIFILGPFIHYKWLADISGTQWVLHFFSNLFFLPGVFELPIAQQNAWSLSYEMFFYIISAFIYIIQGRKNLLFASLVLLIPLIYFYPLAIFLVVGVGLYFFTTWEKTSEIKVPASIGDIAFVGFVVSMFLYKEFDTIALYLATIICSFGFILMVIREEGLFSRLMRTRLFQFLGTISYSLYLCHAFVLFGTKVVALKLLSKGLSLELSYIFFASVSMIVSILVSYGWYYIFENKVTKMLKRNQFVQKLKKMP